MVEIKDRNLLERLNLAQTELKAPKNQYNSFGKYKYRSAEDILEGVKPVNLKYYLNLTLSDSMEEIGGRVYVTATATLRDVLGEDEPIVVKASAREAMNKKGMDDSQITGTASSYARKYALNGLYMIDDTKDADTDENKKESNKKAEKKQKEYEKELQGFKDYLQNHGEDLNQLEQWICKQEKVNRMEQLSFNRIYARYKQLVAKKKTKLRKQEQDDAQSKDDSKQTSLMEGNTTSPVSWGSAPNTDGSE